MEWNNVVTQILYLMKSCKGSCIAKCLAGVDSSRTRDAAKIPTLSMIHRQESLLRWVFRTSLTPVSPYEQQLSTNMVRKAMFGNVISLWHHGDSKIRLVTGTSQPSSLNIQDMVNPWRGFDQSCKHRHFQVHIESITSLIIMQI